MTLSDLWLLILRSFTAPREVGRALLALQLTREARWLALCVVMVLSALVTIFVDVLTALLVGQEPLISAPAALVVAAMQGALILYGAAMMTLFGRLAGGQGHFAGAMVLVTWTEFLLIGAQCVFFLLMIVFRFLAAAGPALMVVLMFWLLTQFTLALHGFRSVGRVLASVLAVFVCSAMLAGALLLAFGLVPEPMLSGHH